LSRLNIIVARALLFQCAPCPSPLVLAPSRVQAQASDQVGVLQQRATIEPNTIKRRGTGLRGCDPQQVSAGSTLFVLVYIQAIRQYSDGQLKNDQQSLTVLQKYTNTPLEVIRLGTRSVRTGRRTDASIWRAFATSRHSF
jgi:hypothetical protein